MAYSARLSGHSRQRSALQRRHRRVLRAARGRGVGGRIPAPVIIGAVVFVAAVSGTSAAVTSTTHSHGHSKPVTATAAGITVPGGSSYTVASWATAFIKDGGWPQTACNQAAITGWENAEGGNFQNNAAYNPLNTTYDNNGTWEAQGLVTATINSAGVRAYNSWATGFKATLTVINNGLYGGILAALSAGNNAQAVADAIGASPWGTPVFTVTC